MVTRTARQDRHTSLSAAWERFAGGDDRAPGVAEDILASWYRSRDVHRIDPCRWSPPSVPGRRMRHSPHPEVFATLGAVAASLVAGHPAVGAIVTDGNGWTVTSLRAPIGAARSAVCWSEAMTGTNGVGTGLVGRGPTLVCGPEHWCLPLHGWSCAAYAVRDVVTRDPIATIAVFARDPLDVLELFEELRTRGRAIEDDLRDAAVRDGHALARAFARASRTHRGPLLAVDDAGGVVAANDDARRWLPRLPVGPVLDPASRPRPAAPDVRRILARAGESLRDDPGWTGRGDFGGAFTGVLDVRPVVTGSGPVGWLLVEDVATAVRRTGRTRTARPARAATTGHGAGGSPRSTTARSCCCGRPRSATPRRTGTPCGWPPTSEGSAPRPGGSTTWPPSSPRTASSACTAASW